MLKSNVRFVERTIATLLGMKANLTFSSAGPQLELGKLNSDFGVHVIIANHRIYYIEIV